LPAVEAELNGATELLQVHPGDLELRHRRGLLRSKTGDPAGAIEDFSMVIAADPWHHLAWVNRGNAYLRLGDLQSAMSDFDQALVLDPEDALTLNDRGAVLRTLGNLDAALANFAAAAVIRPDLMAPRVNAALVLMDLGRHTDVVSVCAEAERDLGDSPDLHRLREMATLLSGDAIASSTDIPQSSVGTEPPMRGSPVYHGRPGFEPAPTDALLAAVSADDPLFEDLPGVEEPPTGILRGHVRYMRQDDLGPAHRALFEFAFPGFFASTATPTDVEVESRLRGLDVEPAFQYRRYAGGVALPRGCYYALDRPGGSGGDGTLAQELLAYAEPSRTGELDAVDLSDPDAARLRKAYGRLFADGSVPVSAIALRFLSRPGSPSPAHDVFMSAMGDFDGSQITDAVRDFPIFVPTRTTEVAVPAVLDLRTPEARDWLLRAVVNGLPTLDYAYGNLGRSCRLLLRGRSPTTFVDLLPLLLFHFRGGSPILDGLAAYLQSVGVRGLVYPSARCNPMVRVVGGKVDGSLGWCFVDYQDAPHPPTARRVIVNPDSWAETTGALTLRVGPEGHPVAGSFAVEGNLEAIASVRRYSAELQYQRNYFAEMPEALSPRFLVNGTGARASVIELRAMLAAGKAALSTRVTADDSGEITVGDVIAAGLSAPPEPYLRSEFHADPAWFVYRIGTWDAELLIHCAVCDFEEIWPLHMGEQRGRCPRCGFAGDSRESPAAIRSRLLRLFGD
jgi:tetratricopeptide (TPR) repeat protein